MSVYRFSRRPDFGDAIKVSFEFFPPKTEAMDERLWDTVVKLAQLNPDFVSVTYGAGGSTREPTARTLSRIIGETGMPAAAHLTCVDATRDEVDAVIADFIARGVRRFVALRGDPAAGAGTRYAPHPQGYANAAELCGALSRYGDIDISVSAYPEKHPESADFATDIDMLKRKVDNGAKRAITQFFFENDTFYRYRDRVAARGIDVDIVPGILPIGSFKQVTNFAARCQSHIPARLFERFDGLDSDPEMHRLVAAAVAAEQVDNLAENGVSEFHFYTLNRAELTIACCRMLGCLPANNAGQAA